ncbi:sensor histidine kinase [Labrys monachus]|uniref:Blue-light-activated histidine kinase n=1 Tax=Labrys monachus TaxID=217067 RepID=A0ABU0FBM8_9HYPH|nr:HWE histidine kinase domain-containing protein [Labrys monachus]MDQ0391455.1 PAS domain S-box-containing protein [Labrys monachus]
MLWHLIAFALALTLPIFFFMAGVLWKYAETERGRMQDGALTTARSIAGDLNQQIAGFIATLEVSAIADSSRRNDPGALRMELDALRSRTGLTLVLLDATGRLRAAPSGFPDRPFPTITSSASLGTGNGDRRITISNLFSDPATGSPSVMISLPVTAASGEDLDLGLILPAADFVRTIGRNPMAPGWNAAILDADGFVVARNTGQDAYVGKRLDGLVSALRQREGTWKGLSLDGTRVFVAFSQSQATNWQVAVEVTKADLEAPLRRSLWLIGLTGTALFSLAMLMAWIIGRRMVLALEYLSESASLVERGGSPGKLLTSIREINIFGKGLAQASLGLHRRGIELAASEERLARILDATPSGIVEIDAGGVVTYANRMLAQSLQMTVDQVIGKSYRDLVSQLSDPGGQPFDEMPLARALKGESSSGVEQAVMVPGNGKLTFAVNAEPLRDADGTIVGALAAFADVTERVLIDAKHRQMEERLRTIIETVPVGIVLAAAPSGRIIEANAAIETIMRHRVVPPPEGQAEEVWTAFHEDGRRVARHEYPAVRALSGLEERPELECNYLRGDGTHCWVKIVGAPLRNEAGIIIGAVVAVMDIDEIKRVQEHQQLMNRELHHRVKNTLATVQGIANLTARSATDIKAFRQTFADRIVSLSRTHTLLVENSWARIPLADLVRLELDPYRTEGHDQVTFEGTDVWLPSDLALALGMAFHELTTNALKFGALSVPAGHIHLKWTTEDTGGERKLAMNWRESGGPLVVIPARSGFGSQLLNNILARQLNGEVQVKFEATGLDVTIRADL